MSTQSYIAEAVEKWVQGKGNDDDQIQVTVPIPIREFTPIVGVLCKSCNGTGVGQAWAIVDTYNTEGYIETEICTVCSGSGMDSRLFDALQESQYDAQLLHETRTAFDDVLNRLRTAMDGHNGADMKHPVLHPDTVLEDEVQDILSQYEERDEE